ncbi:acyl-CoA synthetase (AMP-forming)/AMP-acid ligase II [Actinocorallia herbida]|uniref:Acyl-CoA synthetase (AMP-forming)/AMP-acid ligase II n=1 Tax=Actinocorallia herbida TaxID=58109 RepID=A0A3N1D8R8_9ACTN|nr:acyl-CoA synthetase [Actinocorallia herbida]ROO89920.1 acyl-CoA synthetase (AMP-forming)/AMP-acid ligase II [Actinocorallia herbida]
MTLFHHADLFEGVADALPDRVAVICDGESLTFGELDKKANRLGHALIGLGVKPGDHLGMQLYNGIEYVTALVAAMKIRAVPVNVNYRYVEAELSYLYGDSEIVALLFDTEFDARVAAVAPQAEKLAHLVAVGGATAVPGAHEYDALLAAASDGRGFGPRTEDDLYVIYTGGTTGMPKGVMWRTKDILFAFANPTYPAPETPQGWIDHAAASGPLVMMAVAPLMHGAAQMAQWIGWWMGATMVFVRKFEADGVWRAIEREKVNSLTITGDAMAIPMADALETNTYDLSNLFAYVSTGAILTGAVAARLGALMPNVMIMDRFGSTESGSTAQAMPGSSPEKGLKFAPDVPDIAVLDDDLQPVKPGSGSIGQVARTGYIPVGYYGDAEKTAKTFPEVDGRRWLLTGDLATVEEDGTIAVYGRGSQMINTGGEKVYPEEVEAVLKGHPGVFDAVVTGIPDDRFGSRVAAVVQLRDAGTSEADLDAHCRSLLSGYKVPRTYAFVPEMRRSPAGKADYRWAKETAQNV